MKISLSCAPRSRLLSLILLSGIMANVAVASSVNRETLQVPMRDGVLLATDVYRDPAITRAPVLLMRTPYNKDGARSVAERYAAAGYVAVVQDCRGRFKSAGDFIPYNDEGQDGYDTIEWLGKQPWSNGRIGMWGGSYVGAVQWQAAVEKPPGLMAIAPSATWTSFYRNLYLGGAVRLSLIARWAGGNSTKPKDAAVTTDWDRTLLHLPLSDLDREIGWPIPWLTGMLTHPQPVGYWTRLELADRITDLELPIQHVVGYYDFFSRESVGNFVRMHEHARNPETRRRQQLVLGPWDHGTIGKSQVGEVDFGSNAKWDSAGENLLWFDRYLKQDPAVVAKPFPAVRYFSMGDNVWKEVDRWPPPGMETTAFYLHYGGHANTRQGDGRLDRTPPKDRESADTFRANPADPTPACPVTSNRPLNAAPWAPVDQRVVEDRKDVLVYTSQPLTEPLTFVGEPKVELFVSADTPDADWVARLIDVRPDGFAQNLAVGILRGSFRDSELHTTPLTPDQAYKVTIDLGPVAAQLGKGHRLGLDISGGYFPLFDRNANTGEGPFGTSTRIATEKVQHDSTAAARLLLPCPK